MEQNNFNKALSYTINLANSISGEMQEQKEYELEKIIRLEKEMRFNRRLSLFSIVVAVLSLIVAILTLIATIF